MSLFQKSLVDEAQEKAFLKAYIVGIPSRKTVQTLDKNS